MSLLGNRLPLTHDRVHRPWWTKKDISHSFKNIGSLFLGTDRLLEGENRRNLGLLSKCYPLTAQNRSPEKQPEKAMAPHSSTLAWKIPWTGEPGGLQSMGSLRARHDWAISLSLFTSMHWRRKWQPTPVFLPGESQGWGSLVGCHLQGCTESDTTEAT